MPKVTVDGQEIEVPVGTPVIKAAMLLGIHVPHYCYHPRLPVAGNCRMCLVEIEKAPKLQTSCTTPIERDGMVVRTNTPRVKEAQASVLEFLLLNHPLDCPICDKAGECDLQNLYFQYSARDSRLGMDAKVHKPKNTDIGKYIVLDNERCILCSRCVRFMSQVAKDPVLGIIERGDHSLLTIFPDKRLDSRYSINTADICPVGALTNKEFRFRKRVWFLHHTRSVCPHCATGCPTVIDHNDGKIYRTMPGIRDGEETWLCDPGRQGFGFVNSEARPMMPLVVDEATRGQQSAQPLISSWKDAVAAAVAGFARISKESGADAVAGIFSSWSSNEEAFAFLRLMFQGVGTTNVACHRPMVGLVDSGPADDILIREDKNPNTKGVAEIAGAFKSGVKEVGAIVSAINSGKIRALWLVDPDFLGRLPEGTEKKRAIEALKKLKLLVVQSPNTNETSKLAHILLPSATWAEKEGSFTNGDGLVQKFRVALVPRGEILPDLEIFRQVAVALNRPLGMDTPAQAFGALAQSVPAFHHIKYEQLENGYGRLGGPEGQVAPAKPPASAEQHP